MPGKRLALKATAQKIAPKTTTEGAAKKQKWKREHEEFINAIKASKMISKIEKEGGDIRSVPIIPSQNLDYVQCQYCTRRFAPHAAERHIPKCKDMIHRPKPPPGQAAAAKEETKKKKSASALPPKRPNKEASETKSQASATLTRYSQDFVGGGGVYGNPVDIVGYRTAYAKESELEEIPEGTSKKSNLSLDYRRGKSVKTTTKKPSPHITKKTFGSTNSTPMRCTIEAN